MFLRMKDFIANALKLTGSTVGVKENREVLRSVVNFGGFSSSFLVYIL